MTTTGTFLEEIERQRKVIAELREKLAAAEVRCKKEAHRERLEAFYELSTRLQQERDRLREKLAQEYQRGYETGRLAAVIADRAREAHDV